MVDMNTIFSALDSHYYYYSSKYQIIKKSFEMLKYNDGVLMLDVGDLIDKLTEFLVCFVMS